MFNNGSEPDKKGYEEVATDDLSQLIQRSASLKEARVEYPAGHLLLEEGETNDNLFVLLEGQVELGKLNEKGRYETLDILGHDSILGLISFWTSTPCFSRIVAKTKVVCIELDRTRFEELVHSDPGFSPLLQRLFINNLANRYRRMVSLNLKVASLSEELQQERNQLREIIEDLQRTRARLIHQEKLATLGQLMAGIAHEINNPSAALARNVHHLFLNFPNLFSSETDAVPLEIAGKLLQMGMESPFIGSEEKRKKMLELEKTYPGLKRSLIRSLAPLSNDGLALIEGDIKRAAAGGDDKRLLNSIHFFETGIYLRGVRASADRIHQLVKSLKNYGRKQEGVYEKADLRDGLRDVLVVLHNRLKHFSVSTDLPDIPKVYCNPSEMNQIWTNLLVNACDELKPGGQIRITCGTEAETVWIRVSDNGPGIPKNLLDKIFEPNFTTKSSHKEFGLGLGLTISRDIAAKHGGRLKVENLVEGGAAFTLYLPYDVG